jgi:hypothetical protein
MYRLLLLLPLVLPLHVRPLHAGQFNQVLSIGDKAPAWENLAGVDDREHSLGDLGQRALVVVVFTCNSCPYAVDIEDRLVALHDKFYVLDQQRHVVYMGSMDDSPSGKKVTRRYVEDAIEAALVGKKPKVRETVPIGCRVRYKRERGSRSAPKE